MSVSNLEILVEEPSMEAFLRELLPRILGGRLDFQIHSYLSKDDLLKKLPQRLRGYSRWLPDDWRIVVIVDRDDDDCVALKQRLEEMAARAGLRTRSSVGRLAWQLVNRVAVEELEAWYFGDWEAVRKVYPRVPGTIPNRAGFRDPDVIHGGTWERLENILQKAGYFPTGLRKIELARALGGLIEPNRNRSHSFAVFRDVLNEIAPRSTPTN